METRRQVVPTYEGRPLDRPEEDLVDQGLPFDIGTLISRRGALRLAGAGAAALGLTACSSNGDSGTPIMSPSSGDFAEIPEDGAGPYPGDGSNGPDVLEDIEVVRSDIRSSFGTGSAVAEGVPMTLALTIHDLANGNTPFAGVAVYLWQSDREGRYSMYAEGLEHENYLRGVQIADEDGTVVFTSIFPACYDGRWPHLHFEVYPNADSVTDSANAIATSQVALPADACDTVYAEPGYEQSAQNFAQVSLESDIIFGDDGGVSQLATATGDVSSGYTVSLAVGVDTKTAS